MFQFASKHGSRGNEGYLHYCVLAEKPVPTLSNEGTQRTILNYTKRFMWLPLMVTWRPCEQSLDKGAWGWRKLKNAKSDLLKLHLFSHSKLNYLKRLKRWALPLKDGQSAVSTERVRGVDCLNRFLKVLRQQRVKVPETKAAIINDYLGMWSNDGLSLSRFRMFYTINYEL